MDDSASESSVSTGRSAAAVSASILLVEDFEALRALMTQVLSLEGHEVVGAASVPEAVALCTTHHFDLVVTDCRLPGGTGNEVARAAAAHRPGIAVLFVSGSRSAAVDLEVPGATVRFMEKPVDIDALSACVRELVG
jgi:DNA-binding NtrC family response regulator